MELGGRRLSVRRRRVLHGAVAGAFSHSGGCGRQLVGRSRRHSPFSVRADRRPDRPRQRRFGRATRVRPRPSPGTRRMGGVARHRDHRDRGDGDVRRAAACAQSDLRRGPRGTIAALLRARALSFFLVVGTGLLLGVSLVLSTALTLLVDREAGDFGVRAGAIVNEGTGFVVIAIAFALLLRVLPDRPPRGRQVWIGAVASALLFSRRQVPSRMVCRALRARVRLRRRGNRRRHHAVDLFLRGHVSRRRGARQRVAGAAGTRGGRSRSR